MFITFNVQSFKINENDLEININGDVAKIVEIICEKKIFINFINICSGFMKNYMGSIKINNLELKKNADVLMYIQKHTLFLTEEICFNKALSINENLKLQSQMWSGKDLSKEAIESLNLHSLLNEKPKNLSTEQLNLIHLAKIICCNSHIWMIAGNLLNNIPEENKQFVENILNIRTKQGGLVMLFKY